MLGDIELIELNRLTKYPKIQTLWERDSNFKVYEGHLNPKLSSLGNIKNFILTEKYHGTNMGIVITPENRIYLRKRSTIIAILHDGVWLPIQCSEKDIFHYTQCVKDVNFDKIKEHFADCEHITIIFGEGVGVKIQKNGEVYTDSYDFVVFDVKCGNSFFDWRSLTDFCKEVGLRSANSTEQWNDDILKCNYKDILRARNKERFFEGYVVRSEPPMLNGFGARMMFKIKQRDFKTSEVQDG